MRSTLHENYRPLLRNIERVRLPCDSEKLDDVFVFPDGFPDGIVGQDTQLAHQSIDTLAVLECIFLFYCGDRALEHQDVRVWDSRVLLVSAACYVEGAAVTYYVLMLVEHTDVFVSVPAKCVEARIVLVLFSFDAGGEKYKSGEEWFF